MSNTPSPLTEEAITLRARKLWACAGSPAGRDLEFWLTAETELRQEQSQFVAAPRTMTAPPAYPASQRRRP